MIRQCNLAICGQGAVTPHGLGTGSLLDQAGWKLGSLPSLTDKEKEAGAFRVDVTQEKLARWEQNPRLRRASPIAHFMMEAAQQALEQAGSVDMDRLGIVAALSAGCIVYCRRFFQDSLEQGRRFASPILFPETVYNAPTSHVASALRIPGPCHSLVGDGSAWVTAIAMAACWLELGRADHVLVIGAEELDAISWEAFKTAGWLKRSSSFIAAEGAGALVLRLAGPRDRHCLTAMAEGFHYRTREEAWHAATSCFDQFRGGPRHIYRSAGNTWMRPLEEEMIRRHGGICPPDLPYCGEAFPASAAWHTLRALSFLNPERPRMMVPIWGLNEQVSALQLTLSQKESAHAAS